MDSTDVVDEVNALLKLGVGEPYRLEHIKQTFIQNKKIWITDENYLKRLREKYLTKQTSEIESDGDIVFENEPEDNESIHCWKCGKKCPLGANFCMVCGTSLFEVGKEHKPIPASEPSIVPKSIPLKFPIIVGIPVIILIILGAGYSQGYFDSSLDSTSNVSVSTEIENEEIFYGEFDSKCGPGTVLDPDTNACRVGQVKPVSSGEIDSKCGPGTVFDAKSNSCILE